jgi:radical SAM superfamily enzyme YgiQ (UPF0313 family)
LGVNLKILLVYPESPDTFWSFKHALQFIDKKAGNPPLGLLTVAALLPEAWEKRLVDLNITALRDSELEWADYVFISAMSVQKNSVKDIIKRCQRQGVKMVAGGPLFTTSFEEYPEIDHLVLNEAEITLPFFLEDLEKRTAKHLYTSTAWAEVARTPRPLWKLIDLENYASMSLQYSRGCPFNCDFCDITLLYGHNPRTKEISQILAELDALYALEWRGTIFMVDDNFIGNKQKLKREILPALATWMKEHHHPFTFYTQVSIDLADDDELMELMTGVGFETVFVGIETPHEESLAECHKLQNKRRDLVSSVKKIQKAGLQVQGGFIVGFDNDPPSIFEKQIEFIQKSGIVTAMVGMLNVLRGTKLYQRLQNEERILKEGSGNNTDGTLNFVPRMPREVLINGYKRIVETIYSPEYYYRRILEFFKTYRPLSKKKIRIKSEYLSAFFKSVVQIGILGKERVYFWRLIGWSLLKRPDLLPLAVTYAVYGFHFRKVFEEGEV